MSWERVRAFRDALLRVDAADLDTGLSPDGAREAWAAALGALTDDALAAVAARGGAPYPTASFVAASTVFTAPIEFLTVLLGRGTAVHLKHPAGAPGAAPTLVAAAEGAGLPLTASDDRARALVADLVVAMGSDDTVAALRGAVGPDRLLAFGHRFSAAWATGDPLPDDPRVPEGFRDPWGGVAADAALHDGRGCLSPQVVFTPVPLAEACDALADAMARAQRRWPVGRIGGAEAAGIRSRRALARAVGVVREGDGWSVHGLPAERFTPRALPRSVAVVSVPGVDAARAALGSWDRWLSTVGGDGQEDLGAPRACRLGRMQRPELVRRHDGVDWIGALVR